MFITNFLPFIIRAKKATYVAGGLKDQSSRPGSQDLSFHDGDWTYRDSYFGGTDFLGQETLWFKSEPVWSMIYYGYILRPDLIDGERAAQTLRAALSTETAQGRLLDTFRMVWPPRSFQHIVRRHNRTFQRPRNNHRQRYTRLCSGLHGWNDKTLETS